MKTAAIKSTVAAVTGLFGSLSALFYGYGSLVPIAGIGLFVFTLALQYGTLKIKILVPLTSGLLLLFLALIHNGTSLH